MAVASEIKRWLPVPDYEDRYEVSDDGQVRALEFVITDCLGRTRRQFGRVMAQTKCGFGYHRVELQRDGKRKKFAVHRLVAQVFIGPPPSVRHEVMHLDHDPTNNDISNLKWGTHSENVRATIEAGRYVNHNACKELCPAGHRYSGFDARGTRKCGECRRRSQREYNERRRSA